MKRILIALLLVVQVGALFHVAPASAAEAPLIGPMIIAPYSGSWDTSRDLNRRMGGALVKIQIPENFHFYPHHIDELVLDGAKVIILTTSDCNITYEQVYFELVQRGFWEQSVLRHREIQFILEVGNEPEMCGLDPWTYKWRLIDTAKRLKPQVDVPNLLFMAQVPLTLANTQIVLGGGEVQHLYDLLSFHNYGHHSLDDNGGGEYLEVYQHLLTNTRNPLYLTEVNINDPALSDAERARRITEWVSRQGTARLKGAVVFAIGEWGDHPAYEVTAEFAGALRSGASGTPAACTYYDVTGYSICHGFRDYWRAHGGLMQFGYPLTAEHHEDGLTVQYFERAVFEYHPDNPAAYRILLRRLGAEALEARR